MGESTPAEPVNRTAPLPSRAPAPGGGTGNGLAERVAAVEAARERFGRGLEQLDVEVRAQVSQTAENVAWKILGSLAAVGAGILVRKVLITVWRKATDHDPPGNPADPETTWGEGLAWALASGAAVGIARLVATRGATAGWQKVVGAPPPGMSDVA